MNEKLKKWLIFGFCLLLALVVGGIAGSSMVPGRVEYKDRTVEVQVESTQAKERIADLEKQLESFKSNIHRETVEIKKPDGTIITKKIEDIAVEKTRENVKLTVAEHQVNTNVVHVTEHDVSKVTETYRPDWHISIQGGANVAGLIRGEALIPAPASLLGKPWEIAVQVERRVVGPLYVGLRGSSNQSVMLTVGAEW